MNEIINELIKKELEKKKPLIYPRNKKQLEDVMSRQKKRKKNDKE